VGCVRARLRDEYQQLLVAVETHATWDEDALATAMGAIAHTAYHSAPSGSGLAGA